MIRLPCTPDEILDIDGRDVIEELFTELDMPTNIREDIEARMWDRYGFRPIGLWDVERWVKITRYVARSNWAWYSRFVDAIKSNEILSTDNVTYSEIIDTQAERQESLISEHDGTTGRTGSSTTGTTGTSTTGRTGSSTTGTTGTSTTGRTGTSTTSTTGTSTTGRTGTRTDTVDGTKRTETEDKPDTSLTGQKYLDSVVEATDDTTTTSQSNEDVTVENSEDVTVENSEDVTVDSSEDVTVENSEDVTVENSEDVTVDSSEDVTVQGTDNTETTGTDTSTTTRTGTRSDGTNVASLRAVIDEYRRVSQLFVEEFEPSFMNRW